MEISKIAEEIKIFLEERNWLDFSPSDVFLHLIEELGEISKHLLFRSRYKTEKMGHVKPEIKDLERELAQSFSLFMQLCIILEIDIESAWIKEFKIMKERFPITDK